MALQLVVPDGTEDAAEAAAEAEAALIEVLARVAGGEITAVDELGEAVRREADARRRLEGLRLLMATARRLAAAGRLGATERVELAQALRRAGVQ